MAELGNGDTMDIKEWVDNQNRHNLKTALLDSPDIRVERTGAGHRLQIVNKPRQVASGGSSAVTSIPAVIESGTTLTGYGMSFYANGYDQSITGSGTGYVFDLAAAEVLTPGMQVMALPITVTITGDTE